MELPLTLVPNPPPSSFSAAFGLCSRLSDFKPRKKSKSLPILPVLCVKSSAEPAADSIDEGETRIPFTNPAPEVTAFTHAADFPVGENIGAFVRLTYGIGIYGAMAVAGSFICSVTGIDSMGGFHLSLDCILEGLGYAAPPIMALLFILDDEVVKLSPHARAIRDVEDEDLWSFFYGMSPWQNLFILMVAASSVGEELFYRAAVQGALADIFLRSSNLITDAPGMASLEFYLHLFHLLRHLQLSLLLSSLVFSIIWLPLPNVFFFLSLQHFPFFATFNCVPNLINTCHSSLSDPSYIVAPVLKSHSSRQDLKKVFEAWYEKRQMRKIYSPLLEGLLALYLGFEWIQTNNILAPIITHGIYSTVILGHGLVKIHDHQRKLHQRIRQLNLEERQKFK